MLQLNLPYCLFSRAWTDDKDNARLIVSQVVIDALTELKMAYPKSDAKRRQELQSIREQLIDQPCSR
jgi:hypothetical protein